MALTHYNGIKLNVWVDWFIVSDIIIRTWSEQKNFAGIEFVKTQQEKEALKRMIRIIHKQDKPSGIMYTLGVYKQNNYHRDYDRIHLYLTQKFGEPLQNSSILLAKKHGEVVNSNNYREFGDTWFDGTFVVAIYLEKLLPHLDINMLVVFLRHISSLTQYQISRLKKEKIGSK